MTLAEALKLSMIREDELKRINVDTLARFIKDMRGQIDRAPYDNVLRMKTEAYEVIMQEVNK